MVSTYQVAGVVTDRCGKDLRLDSGDVDGSEELAGDSLLAVRVRLDWNGMHLHHMYVCLASSILRITHKSLLITEVTDWLVAPFASKAARKSSQ